MSDVPVVDVHDPRRTAHVRAGALALVAIFGLCVGAVAFAPVGSGVASWWPAAGAASGLLVLTSPRSWLGYVPAIAVVTALANVVGGRDVSVSLLFGLVNASEALAVAAVLGAFRSRPWLRTSEDFGRLLMAGVTGAAVAGATAAAVVAWMLDGPFFVVMLDVMASHGASQVLVLPLLLLLTDPDSSRARGWSRPVRVGTVVATVSAFALVHSFGQDLPIAFVPFVFLVLGAQVLTLRNQAVVSVGVGVLVTLLTAQGGGPFASAGLSPATMGALVQLDVVVIALLALPLSIAINQRAVALDQALASRETYRRGLAESIIGMVMVRPSVDGLVVLDINPPAAELLQVRAEQLVGKTWTTGLGAHRTEVAEAVDRMLAGEIFGWERELWLDTPQSRCVRLALSWVPDTSSGNLIVAQLVDLTDARLASQALERERDFTQALLAAATGTAIVACDVDGAVTYANQGAARMLGTTTRALCRRRLLTDLYDPASLRRHVLATDAPSGFDALVERARTTGLPDRGDWTWRTDDGRPVRVNVHLSPLREADRTVIGYLAVAEDITARQKEHDLLRTALEREQEAVFRLEELDRTKSEFLATVSHELRTPSPASSGSPTCSRRA
ncbi:PAS domain-containing protein [Nocardioides sp.]|uniref:PAS domain-containing protein n=1 Tax=Nocardioides sp. TaxID=35761 RepID=UPI002B27972F|nr:PAS domain-containing protein [Nocardioides sp.]